MNQEKKYIYDLFSPIRAWLLDVGEWVGREAFLDFPLCPTHIISGVPRVGTQESILPCHQCIYF